MGRRKGPFKYGYLGSDVTSVKQSFVHRLIYTVGKDAHTATDRDGFFAAAYAVRDRLVERMSETVRTYQRQDTKRVYYLSLEFLMGRALTNSLLNMDFQDECREALYEVGLDLEELQEQEPDMALGNGGLGRLAACFLDSMATLRLPGFGYGIRYEYGIFNQRIEHGEQVEHPENWLRYGNPWELPRAELLYPVKFFGRVVEYRDDDGRLRHHWVDTDDVMAMAFDTPVPGYWTNTVNPLRLWSARATRDFDLRFFNEGDYIRAVEEKNASENISRVLYPSDETTAGQLLRLQQEYFFVSATLQDILARFCASHRDFALLPEKTAIQLNDTHPALAIPELMRILLDQHGLDWEPAWEITTRTFAYTNHTLLPEALETWPVRTLETMLPRHLQIIYEINHRFLREVSHHYPGDVDRLRRMSLIEESGERRVRMAHLAALGSTRVNGVAALHTQLMKRTIFRDFDELFPERIVNVTNGITPRRWLHHANPRLSGLISARIGRGWVADLEQLERILPLAEDAEFRQACREAKHQCKQRLAGLIEQHMELAVSADSMFDVQIKRIHEYKRQLLNLLHVITLYNRIRLGEAPVPRTVIFGGKAAPGYARAKLIVRLINDVADMVNNDPAVGGALKVVFIPNYNVSTAEDIIPAGDLSEQISTAGMEASGTGNMKLALNGALTIGTLDGANIEIQEAVGPDNIFVFGLTADQVLELRHNGYDPTRYYEGNAELKQVIDMIAGGFFSPEEPDRYRPLVDSLLHGGDYFLVLADYAAYVECQQEVERVYRDPDAWARKMIINVANMGRFSSDRSIRDYAEKIWGVAPVPHQ